MKKRNLSHKRACTPPPSQKDAFEAINERPVDDISLQFFYKPHTITLLAVSVAAVIYSAFVR